MSLTAAPFLKAFGIKVIYDGFCEIKGIYDLLPIEVGGVDTIAETIKVDATDVPGLAQGKTFVLDPDKSGTDINYIMKAKNPERSGFVVVILERQ